jgi:CRISPR-associated protein Csd1
VAWMSMLYRTYENNAEMAGKSGDGKAPLPLIAHMVSNAHIEITIDEKGNFKGAVTVDKDDSETMIPVTEDSQGRGNGIAPHSLCDNLTYVAGDFATYLSDKKASKLSEERFLKYLDALKSWVYSDYSHPKARAIYEYTKQCRMTSDLIRSGILECNDNGKLVAKKVSGVPYEKAVVRFRILSPSDNCPSAVWEDITLFDSFVKYYMSIYEGRKDICYLKGNIDRICDNHPVGIISSSYKAKLISAQDKQESDFRYLGRFTDSNQALSVSYEATQKAHNALRWLAARQGVTVGKQSKRTYICWNPNGKKVPDLEDPYGLVSDDNEATSNTEEQYKKRLIETFEGYANQLDNNDDIVVIGLDAAITGRLSITYYNELKASDFLERLKNWGETCRWYFTEFTQGKKPYLVVRPPLTKEIVRFAFGHEKKANNNRFIELDDKLMKEQTQRILYCMLDKKPVPRDIVHALAIKASTPMAYSRTNHERLLSTACALIAKYHNDKFKGVEIKMNLDYESRDRSYLFGRLLAVAEKVERSTFSKEDEREPNAIRLQSAFVNHPMRTWYILETALVPYYQKLKPGSREYYKNIISDIVEKLMDTDKNILNKSLEETYLIGYYLQRAELNKSKKENNKNEEDK